MEFWGFGRSDRDIDGFGDVGDGGDVWTMEAAGGDQAFIEVFDGGVGEFIWAVFDAAFDEPAGG